MVLLETNHPQLVRMISFFNSSHGDQLRNHRGLDDAKANYLDLRLGKAWVPWYVDSYYTPKVYGLKSSQKYQSVAKSMYDLNQ